jgi:Zn-ribbon RNA-binding protein
MADVKFDEYGDKIINEVGAVTFKCPACSEVEISRSKKARELSKEYVCPKCGFVGP